MKILAAIFSLFVFTMPAFAVEQPNVLFIAIDDLRPELGTYGTHHITPNFDELAKSGMRFDRAYCQQAVCGASRLSIMGGLYPTRTGEQTFHVDDWRKRHPDLLTMNQHFGASGYQTIGLGKIYHGTSGKGVDPKNWDQWIKLSAPEYALPENNALMDAFKKNTDPVIDPPKGPTTEMAEVSDETFMDGQRASKASDLLRKLATNTETKKPFFLAVGLTKPHLPFVAPKKYWDLYERDQFEMPANKGIPNGYPEYAANLPAWEMKKYSDYEGKLPTDFSDDLNRRLLHGYAACVSYADANLGRILNTLKETGLDKNTIVVVWGDHGWKLGDHSTWCKHTNFECDTRVPLIVRVPGLTNGQPTKRLVELIDLYPTLCDLTGIETPNHCQGKSFTNLLADPTVGHRNAAYSSYPAGKKEIGHSVRFGNYRYTQWHRRGDSAKANGTDTGKHVLTNLKLDSGETKNFVADPEHAEALKKGQALLAKRVAEAVGDDADSR